MKPFMVNYNFNVEMKQKNNQDHIIKNHLSVIVLSCGQIMRLGATELRPLDKPVAKTGYDEISGPSESPVRVCRGKIEWRLKRLIP